jgi:DNA polymerase-3 subunit gamma/tau
VLSRTWQMLLKGIAEVRESGRPIAAAEMVLVRIAYAADLPTPDEAIRALGENGGGTAAPGNGSAASAAPAPRSTMSADPAPSQRFDAAPRGGGGARAALAPSASPQPQASAAAPVLILNSFDEIVALAAEKRDLQMKLALERDMRLVRCEDGRLEVALVAAAAKSIPNELSRKLQQWTGRPWMVSVSTEQGAPTLKQQNDEKQAELETGVRADPLVKAVFKQWPGADIVAVRGPKDALPPDAAPAAEDVLPPADDDGFGDNWVRDDGTE